VSMPGRCRSRHGSRRAGRSAPCGDHPFGYHRAGEPYLPLRSPGRRRRDAGPAVPRSGRCTPPRNLDAPFAGAATPSRRGRRVPRPLPVGVVRRGVPAAVALTGTQPAARRSAACWRGTPRGMNRFLLSGPEGHPFHPLLVPLPIGAFVSSLIFDILTRTRAHGLPYLVDGAYWLIGVGLIGALVAAVFGLLDLTTIPRRAPVLLRANGSCPDAVGRIHCPLGAHSAADLAVGRREGPPCEPLLLAGAARAPPPR
jgi:hypothetical protein